MKTDDLIRAIAHDTGGRPPWLVGRMMLAVVAGAAVALLLFAIGLGFRPNLLPALRTWRFLLKLVFAIALCALAFWTCVRLARPETHLRDVVAGLAAAPALLAVGVGYELMTVPSVEWYARAIGTNSRVCLVAIPLLSMASLAATLAALRAGAPSSPAASGALAGLLAGGLAASLYAMHCPDDSPLFVAIWYCLAIALVAAAGAVAGRRVLRW